MRLQIILQLRPNPGIGGFFGNIPEVFLPGGRQFTSLGDKHGIYPVLWFDAEASIDEEMASQVIVLAISTNNIESTAAPTTTTSAAITSTTTVTAITNTTTTLAGLPPNHIHCKKK